MSADLVPIKRALVSVFDKTGLDEIAKTLASFNVTVLSTGGTAAALRTAGVSVVEVADVTKWPEMLGGRVKTLHPVIHGGILANRKEESHMEQLKEHGIEPIDLVISNLYPFEKTVASGQAFEGCIEMIDIGGPSMVRSAAKNCDSVAIVSDPSQYSAIIAELTENGGALSLKTRRRLARDAFVATSLYDSKVAAYMSEQVGAPALVTRQYFQASPLKYGVNPHQKPASINTIGSNKLPFSVISGTPGYTNVMDALNAWQLVYETEEALGLVAAASFKHVSPAGAAVATPLTAELAQAYEVEGTDLSPAALAYIRARNADPMCSYGDFAAISGVVDVATAKILKREVSDGVIARGFTPEAIEILKSKKEGKYIVLQADPSFVPDEMELKEVYGIALFQKRNNAKITADLLKKVVTKSELSAQAQSDLILATITAKYTQSNSVCYAVDGQVIGVGAGQQSRVDCVKLAGRKVDVWHMRTHPKVRALPFKDGVKRPDRVNARVAYINDDMSANELAHWETLFTSKPEPLTAAERADYMKELKGVSLSSDAFFPFRDNIDQATKHGVSNIVQPGGSVQDAEVIAACDEYGISMAFSGLRVFHH